MSASTTRKVKGLTIPGAAIKLPPKPNSLIKAAQANVGNPTPLAPGVASGNLNAGDPTTNIDNTIAQMRCTVCQSQGIINKALGKTETPCSNCGATNLNAAATAATAARERANAAERAAELALATPSMIPQNKQNKIANAQQRAANAQPRAAIAKARAAGLALKLSPNNLKAAREAANARKAEQAGPASSAPPLPTINTTVSNPSFLPPPPLNASASAAAAAPSSAAAASSAAGNPFNTSSPRPSTNPFNNNVFNQFNTPSAPGAASGGRRSRRRHRKASRRTKNKRYTRRR